MTLRGKLTIAGFVLVVGLVARALIPAQDRPETPTPDVAASPAEPEPRETAPAPAVVEPSPVLDAAAFAPPVARGAIDSLPRREGRPVAAVGPGDGIEVEYTLRPGLTDDVWRVIDIGRVALGHVIVMDADTGEVLAYVSTDPGQFPPTRTYPAASLVKVVTAAAALDLAPAIVREKCRWQGNKYRLNRRSLDPPRSGPSESLQRALASSNNQCFAQWAIHRVGAGSLLAAIDRFGLLEPAAPEHASGLAEDPGDDPLALGRLGSGLDGLRITPLHAAQIAAVLAHGKRVHPFWVARATDPAGRPLVVPLPHATSGEQVLTASLADTLREMLVDTTTRGTARKAFRTRRGRPLLGGIPVAGKTGSLNGHDPEGRYEWFAGVAPADDPQIAIATVAVQGPLYWMSASQMAAEVLKRIFCPEGVCDVSAVDRYLTAATPEADRADRRDLAAAATKSGPGS